MMIKKRRYLGLAVVCLLLASPFAQAAVGLGLSPSRIEHIIEGGTEQEETYSVYNVGTNDVLVRFSTEGEIAPYATVTTQDLLVKPEPQPHKLPLTNAQKFTVRYRPPPTSKPKLLTGGIVATAGPPPGAQFGGNIAIAMGVKVYVGRTTRFWDYITRTHIIVGSSMLGFILLILGVVQFMKKKHIRIRIERGKP